MAALDPLTPDEWQAALAESRAPEAVLGALLQFQQLRALARVLRALDQAWPDDAAWDAMLRSRGMLDLVTEFAEFLATIRGGLDFGASPDAMLELADREYPHALEAVASLAVQVGVPPEDLLSVLLHR